MISSGSPAAWLDLLEQMLPDLLRLVLDTWQDLPGSWKDTHEDEITTALCRALRANRDVRQLPFYVTIQMVELDAAPDQRIGRLDIAFLPSGESGPPSEAVYFCLECKRLNVTIDGRKRPGGSEYVIHGMMRFVSGQYASSVRNGGMLGYVVDGDVASAIANVETNVRAHCADLCMDAPGVLHSSSLLDDVPTAKESFHQRKTEGQLFRVHHLFVRADGLVAHEQPRHSR